MGAVQGWLLPSEELNFGPTPSAGVTNC